MTAPKPTEDDIVVIQTAPVLHRDAAHMGPISTPEAYRQAALGLIDVKAVLKTIAERRSEMTHPVQHLKDLADEWFGSAEELYLQTETALKARLVEYTERRIAEASTASKAAIAEGNLAGTLQAMQAYPQVEGLSYSTIVDFVVEDFNAVPDQYKVASLKRREIVQALKAGESVPGIRRQDRTSLAVTVPKE
jgi:hypothetical protein